MTVKAGLCGFGGLGHVHANSLAQMPEVELAAVCDTRVDQIKASEVKTNLETGAKTFDLSACRIYTDLRTMLRKEKLDALVTALPTDLHAKTAILGLDAGCHVFCEKPMALTLKECDRMIAARDRNNRELQIGQCLRFWPEYDGLLKIIREKTYGRLQSLVMERIGGYCRWAPDNWFNDHRRSGGAIQDLHLHDADWAFYALGKPAGVYAGAVVGETGGFDDITAIWDYADGTMVSMRSSWMCANFTMNFRALFEKAIVEFGFPPDPALQVVTRADNKREKPPVSTGSAYVDEMKYFIECVQGKRHNEICTAESTRNSIEMVLLEVRSARKRKRIDLGIKP